MGKWNQAFVKSVEQFIALKVPIDKYLKNIQPYAMLLDKAEKLDNEMYENMQEIQRLTKRLDELQKDQEKKKADFRKMEAEAAKIVKDYDRALATLENANKKLGEPKIVTACGTLRNALRRSDGLVTLKNKVYS